MEIINDEESSEKHISFPINMNFAAKRIGLGASFTSDKPIIQPVPDDE